MGWLENLFGKKLPKKIQERVKSTSPCSFTDKNGNVKTYNLGGNIITEIDLFNRTITTYDKNSRKQLSKYE